jgi:C1q domain
MAYIGSSATPMPVAFAAVQSQSFNGTGSQTAFTISRSVPSAASLEVLVNNVQQSPYDGSYSVNGTTLTFSEAPSSGTNNVYVIYRDQALGSLVDQTAYRKAEADSLLAAKVSKTGDTMTGALVVQQSISATSNDANFSAGGNRALVDCWVGGGRARIGGVNGGGANLGTTIVSNNLNAIDIDVSGRITMPYQPAFRAHKSTTTTTTGEIAFNAAYYNRGSHFNASNGRFTAPVTGAYFFTVFGVGNGGNSAINLHFLKNGSAVGVWINNGGLSADLSVAVSAVLDLNAGDYVSVGLIAGAMRQSNGDNNGFSGHLIG